MNMYLWPLAAAFTAVGLEFFYRTHPGDFWRFLWLTAPGNIFIGYAVYRLVTVPGLSFINAFIIFGMCTLGSRVLITLFLLRDPVSKGTWVALGLVILANIAKAWK